MSPPLHAIDVGEEILGSLPAGLTAGESLKFWELSQDRSQRSPTLVPLPVSFHSL